MEAKHRLFRRNKMPKRSKKFHKSQADLQGFVVVAFAKDWEQAREYESLLKVNDIPSVVQGQDEHAIGCEELAVMVPEENLDEAHVVIESQNAYDDFYDYSMDEEDESEFDGDFFEDDF